VRTEEVMRLGMLKRFPGNGVVLFLLLAVGVLIGQASAQQRTPQWIYLKANAQTQTEASPEDLGITPRALWRRSKVLPAYQLIDSYDFPISQGILNQIRQSGARIRTVSRWLHAVSVDADGVQLRILESIPEVDHTHPVATYRRRIEEPAPILSPPLFEKRSSVSSLDYGSSFTQLNLIKVIPLHDAGIIGEGVIVGMVDDGYNNHRSHVATARNKVLAERDFIQNDNNTSYESGESPGQGDHGMFTYSALSGYDPGSLIGPAYGSSFLLAKTEITASETQIEEDLYVQGLEWLEQQGADIVSSSLGYIDWYTYADLDGRTAVTTKAALIAARKGVLLVTAMGNENWYQVGHPGVTGTMLAPADADSVISVGAVSSTSVLASFSSTGPTADGRIKPEVVAQGVGVVCASPASSDRYTAVAGTSLSTPLTAGAAALILSSHPWLTPSEVRRAMTATAVPIDDGTSKTSSYPNNFYGYGLVNALEAVLYDGPAFSNRPTTARRDTVLEVYTFILSKSALDPDSLFLYYRQLGQGAFQRVPMTATTVPDQFLATIPIAPQTGTLQGYVSAFTAPVGTRTSPFNAPDSLFTLSTASSMDFVLDANYPNPFNEGTTISFDAPSSVHLELTIYTLLGQRVITLFSGDAMQGTNVVYWNARDSYGARVPSGVYFYRLSWPQGAQSRRMMILK
jgi:serine protease AprX